MSYLYDYVEKYLPTSWRRKRIRRPIIWSSPECKYGVEVVKLFLISDLNQSCKIPKLKEDYFSEITQNK